MCRWQPMRRLLRALSCNTRLVSVTDDAAATAVGVVGCRFHARPGATGVARVAHCATPAARAGRSAVGNARANRAALAAVAGIRRGIDAAAPATNVGSGALKVAAARAANRFTICWRRTNRAALAAVGRGTRRVHARATTIGQRTAISPAQARFADGARTALDRAVAAVIGGRAQVETRAATGGVARVAMRLAARDATRDEAVGGLDAHLATRTTVRRVGIQLDAG